MKLIYFVLLYGFMCYTNAKVFTRCELARELLKTKLITKTFLGNWVCLIEKVSNRNTKLVKETLSKKKSYGLYQIPQKWCKEGKRGGDCNIACEALLDDDIRDDTKCAVAIYEREGFKYWSQWNARCKNDDFITKEIYKCPDLKTLRTSRDRSNNHMVNQMLHTGTHAKHHANLRHRNRLHWFNI